jgi:uncharacterized delta-60 repeat protein
VQRQSQVRARTILLLAAAVATASPVRGAVLAPNFGTGGRVEGPSNIGEDGGVDVLLQPGTGRIVAATVGALLGYLPDGTPDASFGTSGRVTVCDPSVRTVTALARQPLDGKLVVVGAEGGSLAIADGTFVRRYDADGNPDTTFGASGETVLAQPKGPLAVLVLPDGAIVIAGRDPTPSFPFSSTAGAIVRLLPDGTPDGTFGTAGVVTTSGGPASYVPRALVLDEDDALVAGGVGSPDEFVLARYQSDGSLDGTFGTGGAVATGVPGVSGGVQAIARQADGKLVAVGADVTIGVARYMPDGTLDTSYGTGGTIVTTNKFAYAGGGGVGAVVDGAGRAVVYADSSLGRFTADGMVDATFAPCVFTWAPFVGGTNLVAFYVQEKAGLAQQSDGGLIVVGGGATFRMARFVDSNPACQSAASAGSKLNARPPGDQFIKPNGPKIKWTWRSAGTVSIGDFGDPVSPDGDAYMACLLEPGAAVRGLVFVAAGPPWTAHGQGYRLKRALPATRFTDHGQVLDNSSKLRLRLHAGGPGRGTVALGGLRAATHAVDSPPFVTPLTMRLDRSGSAFCWDAAFSAPTRNDPTRFVGTSD